MNRLDNLPEITDQVLSGLRADDSLKYKIYQKAAGESSEKKASFRLPLAALCAISAVMIAAFVLLTSLTRQGSSDTQNYESANISSMPAGAVLTSSPMKDAGELSEKQEDPEMPEQEPAEDSGNSPEEPSPSPSPAPYFP